MNSTRPVRFVHRGAIVEHSAPEPTRTVLQWLREEARCTGTKEGCNEGDCGACTVLVGELGADGAVAYRPVNSCIQFLPTLDGKALLTVEDLSPTGGPLHPVQQAMVDCHGSQCGFCTPGFVISLMATRERHAAAGTVPSRQQIADDLSGNLCRCTGYRPILDAGERACAVPGARLDTTAIAAALRTLLADAPLATASGFFAPKTVEQLATLLQAKPAATILAGSTDVGLWVTKQFRRLGEIVHLGAVAELQRIEERDGQLVIGAGATLEAAWAALAARWPSLHKLWLRFAGRPTREAGTMGGNLANGSPIGDSAPVLMALGATLVLQQGERVRRVALDAFYTGYMKSQREPGEFVRAIELPLWRAGAPFDRLRAIGDSSSVQTEGVSGRAQTPSVRAEPVEASVRRDLFAYKISKRFDCDISAVCVGIAITRDAAGTVTAARLAFGGMAATVARAKTAEAALIGRPFDTAAADAAAQALAADFTPMSDLRASAAYRLQVAGNLIRRAALEAAAGAPVSVWDRGISATEAA
jgi:xanthine dehydrogenase small subunit